MNINKENIKKFLITFVVFLIIDLVWLIFYMGGVFGPMVKIIQGSDMKVNMIYGSVAYLFLAIGITYFGTNNVDPEKPLMSSIINGGLFGLVTYGIFDFTNLAIFENYDLTIAIMDTLWGGFVSAISTYLSYKISTLI